MKRVMIFVLTLCLLLCGCGKTDAGPLEPPAQTQSPTVTVPPTEPVIQDTVPDATQSPTQTSTEPTQASTEPTQPAPQMVTVYLLKKVISFDSGSTEYQYDEDCNITCYTVFTMENTVMYETYFEDRDANGMARKIRTVWSDDTVDTRYLSYSQEGKLLEEEMAGGVFCGFQYAYDQNGSITEKREYYDGMLQSAVYYEYDGEMLNNAWCEDSAGCLMYVFQVEKGLVAEKNFFDSDESYGYTYEYDENNNLIKSTFLYEGEAIPGDQFFYEAVEVDARRAQYLREQQKYLLPNS